MRSSLRRAATVLATLTTLALVACGQRAVTDSSSRAAPTHADASPINWFNGDVNAAFAAAAKENKPVLLYWGAVWCPPCQQLKATVFQRADFVAKTKFFVPVYLDGDEVGAQKWGDQFRVTGYPTLLVLSPQRVETMRIAGGMDLNQYANILDLALAELQPVDSVLDAARQRALTAKECSRLALNAWVLDDLADGEAKTLATQLQTAAMRCPESSATERARLMLLAAGFQSRAEADALKAGKAPSQALRALVAAVTAQLHATGALLSNADAAGYLGKAFFAAVKFQGEDSALSFYRDYAKLMDAVNNNANFAAADHLGALANKLEAAKALTGGIDPALARSARAQLDAALAMPAIPYVRSGLINAALAVFDLLGANAEAYQLLQGELVKTQTPYYYQADLADLAEQLGRKDEALAWSEKAYAGSRGIATRFQWGRLYLDTLLRLKPNDAAGIQAAGLSVLGELDGTDRIYRRARLRLATLDKDLREWQAADQSARRPVLLALRVRMEQTCVTIPSVEPARRSCDAFLKTGL